MSIKANELRIGNFVKLQGVDKPFKVFLIDTTESSTYTKAEPISLTKEWLIRIGFEWSIQHQAHYLKGFDYVIDVCDGFCRVIKYRRNGDHLIDVKYLHELQNLYFALTNQELEIKR